jgi:hypothetical protein
MVLTIDQSSGEIGLLPTVERWQCSGRLYRRGLDIHLHTTFFYCEVGAVTVARRARSRMRLTDG